MSKYTAALVAIALMVMAGSAKAGFMVEAHPTGKAYANFTTLGHTESAGTPSTAAGVQATGHSFGNPANATGPDRYTFSYTPGTNADNTVFAPGTALGNTSASDADGLGAGAPTFTAVDHLATGEVGGITGTYKVYVTWPASTNVNTAGSIISIDGDTDFVLNPVIQNTVGTPQNTQSYPAGATGANNLWMHVATVDLTAGNTYSVVVEANAPTFVSQRMHGVLWELQPIPEPTTAALLALAAPALLIRRRRA